jgi:splicing factor 3A subunit 1
MANRGRDNPPPTTAQQQFIPHAPIPTTTKEEMVIQGIIRPPPEIRVVADRTALYVAKNGRTFETRILNSAKGQTPKFAFLHATSPFHAYYEDRIQFYENGGVDEKENTSKESATTGTASTDKVSTSGGDSQQEATTAATNTLPDSNDAATTTAMPKASAIDPIAKALLVQRTKIAQLKEQKEQSAKSMSTDVDINAEVHATSGGIASANTPLLQTLPPPTPLHFVHILPPASLTLVQLETIQLTAQFVAMARNSRTFNFLQELTAREWNNPVFGFCQPRHGHFAYFSALVDAYVRLLTEGGYYGAPPIPNNNSCMKEWSQMANNVDYCLQVSAYRAEYQRDEAERARLAADGTSMNDAVATIDWHDFVVVETIDFAVDEIVTMLPPPPPPPPLPSKRGAATDSALLPSSSSRDPNDMQGSSDDEEDDDGETIRVVPSYTPKVYAAHETNTMETVIDPITGKRVAVKDMPEHMRIQLLDPKWAQERKKFQDKQKESNLVSGDMVATNLERFAQARGDRFGKTVRCTML